MNGRIYDPKLGRFLQADSSIDGVTSTQGYNRYSYVHNNPLNAIDPSGHFLEKRLRPFKHIIRKFFKAIGIEASQFLVAVGSAFCGLYAPVCAAAGSYDIARAYGTSSNEALRGAAIAGASAFVFTQIGSRFTSTQSGFWQVDGVGHIGAHALAGGVISVLQGGKFGHGFISAGLTKGLDVAGLTDFGGEGGGWVAARTAVAATAGGTISAATGGKFANGARTAAFGHLYNQERARARSNAQKGVPISDEERAFAEVGDRKGFWTSRTKRGDAMGQTALDIVNNDGVLTGKAANLFARLGGKVNGADVDLDALGVDLMRAHVVATDFDSHSISHHLNVEQIQRYHRPVFENHNIPMGAHGGTIFNIPADHWLNAPARTIYCPNCDKPF